MAATTTTTNVTTPASEHWEEICEWDIEEDMDLAQRITVHSVHHPTSDNEDEDSEYQLVQAHKHPTYAAAAKWGSRNKKSNLNNVNNKSITKENGENDNVESKKIEEHVEKKGVVLGAPTNTHVTTLTKVIPMNTSIKSSNENITKVEHYETSVKSNPTYIPPLLDHEVTSFKSSRLHNTHVHKLQTQRLLSQLVSPSELECNAGLVRGDTNRDPEYKKYKVLKKTVRSKNIEGKSKANKKGGVEKLRVEVW